MKTPVRPVRIDDELWKAAQRVAAVMAQETGLSATPSDVVRKALADYVERWKAARRAAKPEKKTDEPPTLR
jgi:hypothetical protein